MNRKALWMTIKPRLKLLYESGMGISFMVLTFLFQLFALLCTFNNRDDFDWGELGLTF